MHDQTAVIDGKEYVFDSIGNGTLKEVTTPDPEPTVTPDPEPTDPNSTAGLIWGIVGAVVAVVVIAGVVVAVVLKKKHNNNCYNDNTG